MIYVRLDLGGQRLKVGACYRHHPDLEATGSPLSYLGRVHVGEVVDRYRGHREGPAIGAGEAVLDSPVDVPQGREGTAAPAWAGIGGSDMVAGAVPEQGESPVVEGRPDDLPPVPGPGNGQQLHDAVLGEHVIPASLAASGNSDPFGLPVVVDDRSPEHRVHQICLRGGRHLGRGDDGPNGYGEPLVVQQRCQHRDGRRPSFDGIGTEVADGVDDGRQRLGGQAETPHQELAGARQQLRRRSILIGGEGAAAPEDDTARAAAQAEPTPLSFEDAELEDRRSQSSVAGDRGSGGATRVGTPHEPAGVDQELFRSGDEVIAIQQRQLG
jgi:hypothetical protein